MKKVMVKAVEFARKMEGDWIARMALGLKMAWALVKKASKEVTSREISNAVKYYTDYEVSVWEKYGKERLYVNYRTGGGYKNTIGYLELRGRVIVGKPKGSDKLIHQIFDKFEGYEVIA